MKIFTFLIIALTLHGCGSDEKSSKLGIKPTTNTTGNQIPGEPIEVSEKQQIVKEVVMDLPVWEKNATELQASYDQAIKRANSKLDKIASIDIKNVTFENTIKSLEDIYYEVDLVWNRASLLGSTSPNKKLRNLANILDPEFTAWYTDVEARKDIYEKVQAYASTNPKLSGEDKRLLDETIKGYKRVGFHLSKEDQEKVKVLKKELSKLTSQFSKNVNAANAATITMTPEEMRGIPESILKSYKKTEKGDYIVQVGVTSSVYGILRNSPIEATRKKAFVARNQRAKETNSPIADEVLKKRTELARTLGYKNWADYKIEPKMAKTGKTASDFVQGLIDGLQPKYEAELSILRALKAKETGKSDVVINAWDTRYFIQQLEKTKYNLDLESLRKYFSYQTTLQGMFDLFSELFQIKIEFVKAPYVWQKDVTLVKISDSRSGRGLGHLYLDMFPRPESEKYGHFAMFTIRSGKVIDGKYRRPVASLVCNFPVPTKDEPSLLTFDHVETLFHEFGHALHGILTETKYASFAGTRVARDFVEAPSQMLEYFVHDKNVLDRFAVNYQDPNDKIPEDTLRKIEEASLATVATFYRRQLAFGKMDLQMHQGVLEKTNKTAVEYASDTLSEVYLEFPEETSFLTNFGHLFGGYDAGYYGYAWADSLAADMGSVFEASPEGFLDKEIGMKLREEIYQTGSSREITDSIEAFLGRSSNNKAFLEKLGIE